jgi:hypothetical protein
MLWKPVLAIDALETSVAYYVQQSGDRKILKVEARDARGKQNGPSNL